MWSVVLWVAASVTSDCAFERCECAATPAAPPSPVAAPSSPSRDAACSEHVTPRLIFTPFSPDRYRLCLDVPDECRRVVELSVYIATQPGAPEAHCGRGASLDVLASSAGVASAFTDALRGFLLQTGRLLLRAPHAPLDLRCADHATDRLIVHAPDGCAYRESEGTAEDRVRFAAHAEGMQVAAALPPPARPPSPPFVGCTVERHLSWATWTKDLAEFADWADAFDCTVAGRREVPVSFVPAHQWMCLDVATPATLALAYRSEDARFGQPCDGAVVGDGRITIEDFVVPHMWQQKIFPYDRLSPSAITIDAPVGGYAQRCEAEPPSHAAPTGIAVECTVPTAEASHALTPTGRDGDLLLVRIATRKRVIAMNLYVSGRPNATYVILGDDATEDDRAREHVAIRGSASSLRLASLGDGYIAAYQTMPPFEAVELEFGTALPSFCVRAGSTITYYTQSDSEPAVHEWEDDECVPDDASRTTRLPVLGIAGGALLALLLVVVLAWLAWRAGRTRRERAVGPTVGWTVVGSTAVGWMALRRAASRVVRRPRRRARLAPITVRSRAMGQHAGSVEDLRQIRIYGTPSRIRATQSRETAGRGRRARSR
jgi:hypothetical protein